MENLKDLIRELQNIKKEFNLNNLTDDCLFENSVDIFISQNIESGKDKRTSGFHKSEFKSNPYPSPQSAGESASEKQLWALKKMGIQFNKDITKAEAFKLISEAKNKAEEGAI